ncbi:hypothetical protein CWI38_0570p0010 [Hamiltosporidium tvaerminnensis]|uniref:C3H1-type domain-containing protein n=1 Tax=Hamiltosporidium tvaerminnensis TaxID=1176355 RepID=A0A4Q9LWD2_9MICR|nr:hypothetical protein CWI38_0570p0010 [Hamiltosporidium tvaerminnensis]
MKPECKFFQENRCKFGLLCKLRHLTRTYLVDTPVWILSCFQSLYMFDISIEEVRNRFYDLKMSGQLEIFYEEFNTAWKTNFIEMCRCLIWLSQESDIISYTDRGINILYDLSQIINSYPNLDNFQLNSLVEELKKQPFSSSEIERFNKVGDRTDKRIKEEKILNIFGDKEDSLNKNEKRSDSFVNKGNYRNDYYDRRGSSRNYNKEYNNERRGQGRSYYRDGRGENRGDNYRDNYKDNYRDNYKDNRDNYKDNRDNYRDNRDNYKDNRNIRDNRDSYKDHNKGFGRRNDRKSSSFVEFSGNEKKDFVRKKEGRILTSGGNEAYRERNEIYRERNSDGVSGKGDFYRSVGGSENPSLVNSSASVNSTFMQNSFIYERNTPFSQSETNLRGEVMGGEIMGGECEESKEFKKKENEKKFTFGNFPYQPPN